MIIGITPVHHITSCLWHQVWWISLYLLKHPGNPPPLPGLDLDGPKCPNAVVLSLISCNSILDCANHHSCQYTNRNRCWLPVCLTPAKQRILLAASETDCLYFLLSAKKQSLNASCFTIVTLPPAAYEIHIFACLNHENIKVSKIANLNYKGKI